MVEFTLYSSVAFGITAFFLLIPVFRLKFVSIFSLEKPFNQEHLAPLDSFRGFAALIVAMFHTWQWLQPYNNYYNAPFVKHLVGIEGVPIFGILSGFLLLRSARKSVDSPDSIRHYFYRRVLRIYPLYAVVTVVILYFFTERPLALGTGKVLLGNLTMMPALGYPHVISPVAWSIYLEEIFYFSLPLLLLCFRNNMFWLSAAMFAIGTAISPSTAIRGFGMVKFFALGVFCSLLYDRLLERKNSKIFEGLFFFGLLYLALYFSGTRPIGQYLLKHGAIEPDPQYFLDLNLGFACLMLGSLQSSIGKRLFSFYPLRFLGIISYSIYLWHPVLLMVGNPIVMDATGNLAFRGPLPAQDNGLGYIYYFLTIIFWSALSYLVIERPFLKMRSSSHLRVDGLKLASLG